MPATKHGRDWLIDPAEVEKRLQSNPGPGRPSAKRLTIVSTNPFRKTGCLKQKYHYDSDFRIYGKIRFRGAIRTAAVINDAGRQWTRADFRA